jgi:DNA-binding transcriptional LysR family regulator
MRAFRHAFPDAELLCEEMPPHLQHEAIQNGTLDVGYMPDYHPKHHAGLVYEAVGEWQRVIVMSSDHPLVAEKKLTIEMLADQPLILYSISDVDSHIDAILQNLLGDRLHIAYRIPSTLSILAMAGAGLGVALVPAPLAQVAIPGVVYRVLDSAALTANLMLVSRKDERGGAVRAYLIQARKNIGM